MIAFADAVVIASFAGLAVSGAAALWRIIVGPTLADRIIALDFALVVLMIGIAVDGINRNDATWFNLLVVIAIIGLTATVAATQFMERRPDVDEDVVADIVGSGEASDDDVPADDARDPKASS